MHMIEFTVEIDWPTQMGYDSDHPLAEGKVGKAGLPIDSIEDMRILFQGINLEEVSTSMNSHATGYILLAYYTVLAKQQAADLKELNGTILIENDERGGYIYPYEPSMWIINSMSEWCSTALPKWKVVLLSDYPGRQEPGLPASGLPASGLPASGLPASGLLADDSIRQLHAEKLESLKRRRNPARVDSILQDLNDKASARENIMPVVIEAAENLCTVGEIADTLREIFGEYRP